MTIGPLGSIWLKNRKLWICYRETCTLAIGPIRYWQINAHHPILKILRCCSHLFPKKAAFPMIFLENSFVSSGALMIGYLIKHWVAFQKITESSTTFQNIQIHSKIFSSHRTIPFGPVLRKPHPLFVGLQSVATSGLRLN